jgi:hypothetical protein
MRLLLVVTLSASLSVIASSAAQSLAELSRATEAARNATASRPAAPVYTNKDLLPSNRPASNQSSASPVQPSAPDRANASSIAPAETLPPAGKDETYWRERMRPLRDRLDRARALADNTKRRADGLMRSSDKCFRIGMVCEDYNESLRLTDQHKTLLAEVARAEQDVFALEEEARRAGVPPGWLR